MRSALLHHLLGVAQTREMQDGLQHLLRATQVGAAASSRVAPESESPDSEGVGEEPPAEETVPQSPRAGSPTRDAELADIHEVIREAYKDDPDGIRMGAAGHRPGGGENDSGLRLGGGSATCSCPHQRPMAGWDCSR